MSGDDGGVGGEWRGGRAGGQVEKERLPPPPPSCNRPTSGRMQLLRGLLLSNRRRAWRLPSHRRFSLSGRRRDGRCRGNTCGRTGAACRSRDNYQVNRGTRRAAEGAEAGRRATSPPASMGRPETFAKHTLVRIAANNRDPTLFK